jgi:hypothetical protein
LEVEMIRRFLASAAVAAMLTGTAWAQMSAPPSSSDQNGSAPPANIQTQNPGPRSQAQAPADQSGTSSSSSSTSTQSSSKPSMTQRAASAVKRTGQKAKSAMSGSHNKQTAEGHKLDNIANQLNACETKSQSERQSCIDQATRM